MGLPVPYISTIVGGMLYSATVCRQEDTLTHDTGRDWDIAGHMELMTTPCNRLQLSAWAVQRMHRYEL